MEASLQKINPFFRHAINQPVLLCDASAPASRQTVAERFWFSDSLEWVTQDCVNQVQHSEGDISLCLNPISQVFHEFGLDDCDSLSFFFRQGSGAPPTAVMALTFLASDSTPLAIGADSRATAEDARFP